MNEAPRCAFIYWGIAISTVAAYEIGYIKTYNGTDEKVEGLSVKEKNVERAPADLPVDESTTRSLAFHRHYWRAS
jgi:hypothetical protein